MNIQQLVHNPVADAISTCCASYGSGDLPSIFYNYQIKTPLRGPFIWRWSQSMANPSHVKTGKYYPDNINLLEEYLKTSLSEHE